MSLSCGIDFGTSNSSVAVATENSITLAPVEGASVTIPSALFFRPEHYSPAHGREAIALFIERNDGRFMRSLKRVLGTTLMEQGTLINNKLYKFPKIISFFLDNIKSKAEKHAGYPMENVVLGRPVHFIDNDPLADSRAQDELRSIAMSVGYKHVEFQFEPIAAAFAHEVNVTDEKLVLVADLGGGTSDFTVIRLSQKLARKADRSSDILANTGVRIGGNDFDKALSLAAIMPHIGYGSTYGEKHLEVPLKFFHDLAEWSKVNFLYTPKIISRARQLLHESHDKKRFGRLLTVLERETGHALLGIAEQSKIALTTEEMHAAQFQFIDDGLSVDISRKSFEAAIENETQKVLDAAITCLKNADVSTSDIELVILTGGSTEIPLVQAAFGKLFPHAKVADENRLSSVGLGLAYDSRRKFS